MKTFADVTTTENADSNAIGAGSPIDWPTIWSRCDLANRVKSGMFSASVAQKPTIAVSPGQNVAQKRPSFLPPATNCDGADSIVPSPPAFDVAHQTRAMHMTTLSGADQLSSQRIESVPCRMK